MKIDTDAAEMKRAAMLLKNRYSSYMESDETFTLTPEVKGPYICLKTLMANADRSFYYPVEARINLESTAVESFREGLDILMDFTGHYFEQFLKQDRDVYLPLEFGEHEYLDHKVEARGQVFNRKLEDAADKLIRGELTADEVSDYLKK